MSKRRRPSETEGSIFDGLQDTPSLADATDEIFGVQPFPDIPTMKIKYIDIDLISPDLEQPRRAVPSELRALWNPISDIFQDLLDIWIEYLEEDFNLEAYLLDGMTSRATQAEDGSAYEPTAVQASFLRLLDLAASILREGLTNPITVSRHRREYLIETGERRWMAYHLLNTYFRDTRDEDWSKIPARIMPERNIWRQATENNARQNLNAVSRARQLALLLMDIYGRNNFQPLAKFEYEQDFYGQVSDGTKYPFESHKKELLLKSMGLNSPTQLRQYRSILRAERWLWQQADDENWTENAIREEMQKSKTGQVTRLTKAKKPKRVTTVTPEQKASIFDQAIDRLTKDRSEIERYARNSQNIDRIQWQNFARRQAEFWNKLADELDD